MASVDKLPPEILSIVFSLLFRSVKEDLIPLVDSQAYELHDILLVCRRWNKVACQTPSIWTTVYVGNDEDSWLRVWRCIERSGDLPLDIVFMSLRDDEVLDRVDVALKALIPLASRWRSLSLPYMVYEINELLGSTSLPNLIELFLLPISQEDEDYSNDTRVCIDAPKLETLLIKSYEVYFHNDQWPRLKSLEARGFWGCEEWLWGLLGSSQETLERLVLRRDDGVIDVNNQGLEEQFGEQINCSRLSALTTLEISGVEMENWSALRFAEMPLLKHLIIAQEVFPRTKELEEPVPTFSSLDSLSISTDMASDIKRAIEFLLPLAPNIASLTLHDGTGQHATAANHLLVPVLRRDEATSEPLFCKKLEELTLGGDCTPVDKLKDLVELRGSMIKKISCDGGLWGDDDQVEERNLEEHKQLLEWLEERVELSGVKGWWDGEC
ncbi:hypothetical protein FRC04_003447 [Tulasnella sp. 424]|nr:hypothetical protein FRC04_003447 [Tulasnella sp. 424]KAG8965766.1 hypothetical protein FRC05_003025 [Tulasnella sp. 425]